MKKLNLFNRSGMGPDVMSRKGRYSLDPILSRLCVVSLIYANKLLNHRTTPLGRFVLPEHLPFSKPKVNWLLHVSLICLCMLTIGSGNVWGAVTSPITLSTTSSTVGNGTPVTDKFDYKLTFTSVTGSGSNYVQNAKSASIYNTVAIPGAITSIKLTDCATTSSKTDGGFTIYGGTSEADCTHSVGSVTGLSNSAADKTITFNSSDNYTFFKITNGSARVLKISSIVISFSAAASYTITYNSNGGSGSMSSTTGATVNAATCTFTAPTGKVFDHWNTASNNSGTSYNAGASVNATVTLYAIWRDIHYTLKVSNGNGGYTTYNNKVKSDLTQATAEGGNSCAGGLDGTYSGWRVGALETPAASPGTTYNSSTAGAMPSDGSTLYAVFRQTSGSYYYLTNPSCAAACANSVTINKGTSTNCSFTLSPSGAQESCDGVTTTVSITPTTGYGNPSVTQSGASAAPTISGSGNSWTVTYAANTTGTSTINVSCSANNYTITLDKDLTPTTAGTASITATYNSNSNLTSAITKPIKTGWTFGGYFTAKNGGGTQIIGADGNVIASVSGYTDASKNWKYNGNITLYAKWTCTVTWSVNGLTNVYSAQTVTYNSSSSKVASVPTPDPASYCGDIFAGWSQKNAGSESKTTSYYDDLFKTVGDSPDIKSIGDITFYAVFAEEDD